MPDTRTAFGWVIKGMGGVLQILTAFLADGHVPTPRDCDLIEYQAARLIALLVESRRAAQLPPYDSIRSPQQLRDSATWGVNEVVELEPIAPGEYYRVIFDE